MWVGGGKGNSLLSEVADDFFFANTGTQERCDSSLAANQIERLMSKLWAKCAENPTPSFGGASTEDWEGSWATGASKPSFGGTPHRGLEGFRGNGFRGTHVWRHTHAHYRRLCLRTFVWRHLYRGLEWPARGGEDEQETKPMGLIGSDRERAEVARLEKHREFIVAV